MKVVFDHIAFLVEEIEPILERTALLEVEKGPIEAFESEGTREVYLGPAMRRGRVLLMEAIGPGPYLDAMKKRGAGLHHIAVVVEDILAYLKMMKGSGWYLHSQSLAMFQDMKMVFLARPGVPVLIEVQQRPIEVDQIAFAFDLEVAFAGNKILKSLQCDDIHPTESTESMMKIGQSCVSFKTFY